MMHLLHSITLFLALVRPAYCAESLTTTFTGPNDDLYSDGDKFSILTGATPVTIERFDIHMAAITVQIFVYCKWGYTGWDYESGYWMVDEWTVTGLGQGVATPLPAFSSPIQMPANSNLGCYVTLNDKRNNNMYHSDGSGTANAVFASDGNIEITEGLSQWHFMSQWQGDTRWNGEYPPLHKII